MKKFTIFLLSFALLMFVFCNTTVQGQDGHEAASAEPETAITEIDIDDETTAPFNTGNSCINCHSEIEGSMENLVDQFMGSVHREMDFTCEVCHGGDPTLETVEGAMNPEAGFIGKPDRAEIPGICARCHSDSSVMKKYGNMRTDQLDLYKTSVHGAALFENGDTNVAVCIDCHSAHNILRVNNPEASVHKTKLPFTCANCHSDEALMGGYGLDHTIPQDYMEGEHGKAVLENGDLGAPVCNNCHGSHGAAPPGVESIEYVCGQCHLQTEKLYNQSRHSEVFAELGMGRCVVCHNQHKIQKPTDDYFDENADTNCGACHSEGEEQHDKILAMRDTISGIRGMHEQAGHLVEDTEHTTHLSMHDMIPQVEQIRTKLLTARILQHGTNVEDMEANLGEAETQFAKIEEFTNTLLERAAFNKRMVLILAIAFCAYGLLVWAYRKFVLDHTNPWAEYDGGPLDGDSE